MKKRRSTQQGDERRYPFQRSSFQKEIINISMQDFEFTRYDEKLFTHGSRHDEHQPDNHLW